MVLKSIVANKLVRQVSLLLSGTMLVQLINFGFMPLVLRIYGPAEFGELGTFNALLLILFPLAALCLPMAVVQGRNRTQSRHIASLAWLVALGFSSLLFVLLLLFKQPLLVLLSVENIGNLVFLLPLAMLFAARLQIAQQILIKQQQFKVLAKADVLQALLVNLSRLLFGLWQSISAVLITIAAFGYMLHAILLQLFSGRAEPSWQPVSLIRHLGSRRYWLGLRRTLRKFRAFPLFQTPQALLNAAAQSAPVLILAALYGSTAAGFYTLAKTVLMLPAILLGRAVGDVFYPHFTKAYQQGKPLAGILVKATLGLAAVGLIPFSVFIVAGPWLFDWVFGAQWQQSGDYARWMAVWLYFAFVNTPSVKAVMVLQVQHWAIALNVLTLSLRLALLWFVGSHTGDPIKAIAAFAMVGVMHSAIFTLMALYFSKARQPC
ncbi:lipopolysaccharide biosynthesis protein [Rheinheimera sp. D18]|uniref:lipopolysaccharide biosynthesis protein n=1 Tax=Rheinheimera sp. D18 TaxID=2545632 RepID=UPI00104ED06C|nr:oligosaccharide flippase family protein [Rheinheimera sp. D18]QBL09777.1 lipopolysaccharide biosynthesis protein [Rheinheimera sp. D18]